MKIPNNFSTSIHTVLKNLIEEKSRRDKNKFTSYQLANAISMPRSMITKLIHTDKSKRVMNPRIDTLLRIVEFFRLDGFNITIDDFLGIDVQSQNNFLNNDLQSISLYSLNDGTNKKIGTVEIKLPHTYEKLLAFCSDENIEPFFKAGSIFIVNSDMKPAHDTLIAIKLNTSKKILIKKYLQEKNKTILRSLNHKEKDITLMPTTACKILGVVIQVNAKT